MMVRIGASKKAPVDHWTGRRDNARAFHEAARTQVALLSESANANPIISLIATAAIGYADSVTSKRLGVVNQEQHEQVVTTLRKAVGNRLTAATAKQLSSILKEKSTSQYGARRGSMETATRLLDALDAFAQWVEQELGGL